MLNQFVKAIALMIALSLFTHVANAAAPGHYYLNGITEVGSELLLNPDGHYQAVLMYGTVDLESSGIWQQTGNLIELQSSETQQTVFKGLKLLLQQDKLYPQESPLSTGYYQK